MERFRQKLGPLELWQWALIALLVLGVGYYLYKRGGGGSLASLFGGGTANGSAGSSADTSSGGGGGDAQAFGGSPPPVTISGRGAVNPSPAWAGYSGPLGFTNTSPSGPAIMPPSVANRGASQSPGVAVFPFGGSAVAPILSR